MAPRRAAAVSAATSISNAAAGPSAAASSAQSVKGAASQDKAKGRISTGGGQEAQRKASGQVLPVFTPAEPPLSPIVSRLRTMWKFAAVCQFLFTFDEAFGMSGFETEALERDLDGTETRVVPDLMRRLLYTLTLNRNIDESNWEEHLRSQYLTRDPDNNILGTLEEPVPWAALPLRQKIETLHQTCEWQLWDAERFRKLVKNEEDAHVWRIDPIGWDSKDNTYWLFDDNRLWVQHPRPAPVWTKAPPKKNSKKAKAEAAAARRAAQSLQKRKREESKPKSIPIRSSARNRQSSGATEPPAFKRGRRSRHSTGIDGWEEVPPELLYDEQKRSRNKEGDEDSDLSDPPSADENISMQDISKQDALERENAEDITVDSTADTSQMDEVKHEEEEEEVHINGRSALAEENAVEQTDRQDIKKEEQEDEWVEFETIAVGRREWEAMSTRFAKSKHPDEKALHQLLHAEVLPKVMADIAEEEKQRAHEAAMANRKRSSRIALKESEREEKERDRIARLKMEEKMATIRAEEAQKAAREREEVEAAKSREERIREREERQAAREREAIERAEREIMERENREKMREMRKLKREQLIANGGLTNESEELQQHQQEDDDSWELDCEVCGKAGINLDDTEEIVCCEKCGVWQHTECWNAFDRSVGRPAKDWEKVDFLCSRCDPPPAGQPRPQRPGSAHPPIARIQSENPSAASVAVAPVVPSTLAGAPPPGPSMNSAARPTPQSAFGGYIRQQPTSIDASQSSMQPRSVPQLQSTAMSPLLSHGPPNGHGYPTLSPVQRQSGAQITPQYMQRPPPGSLTPYTQQPLQRLPYEPQQSNSTLLQSQQPARPSVSSAQQNPASIPNLPPNSNASGRTEMPAPVTITSSSSSPSSSAPLAPARPRPIEEVASPHANKEVDSPISQGTPAVSRPQSASLSPSALRVSPSQLAPKVLPPSPSLPRAPPISPKTSPSLPRSISSQPSGSFPMRHSTARSPLSRPEGYVAPQVPAMNLGPPRATSPSPIRKPSTVHTAPDPLLQRQTASSDLYTGDGSTPSISTGPGPSSGSLARTPPSKPVASSSSTDFQPASGPPSSMAPQLIPQQLQQIPQPPQQQPQQPTSLPKMPNAVMANGAHLGTAPSQLQQPAVTSAPTVSPALNHPPAPTQPATSQP